jgi:dipeptidyl aminopeptidase/acylaminoacyl peptidase
MAQHSRAFACLFACFFLFAARSDPGAQSAKLLDKETFMEMESVGAAAISPDGRQIVFARTWIDKMKDQSRSNLWIVDVDGARVRELTRGGWRDSGPVWAPDSKRIAFLSDRDGTNQLHVMYVDTGEVAQLTHLQRAPSGLKWSPDGKQIAFSQTVPDEDPILRVELPKRPRGAEWARGAVIVDRLTWARDGTGPVEKGYSHVYVVDAVLGGTPKQITDGKFNHSEPEWSADGQTIFVGGMRKPEAEYQRGDSEIYAVDLKSGQVKTLTDRKGPDSNPSVSPNGKFIAYTGNDDKDFTSHLSSLYLMDSSGGSKRVLAGDLNNSPGDITWARDNSGVYFTVAEKGSESIYFAPLSGAPRKVSGDDQQTLGGLSFSETGQVVAVRSTPYRPGVIATFKIDAAKNPASWKTLVDVNDDVLSGVKLGDMEEIWYTSKDGLKVQGWLIKPANFQPGRKYPMVLWIHGGPWSMYDVGFNWSFQNFAASGYAVLYTNPRGSTGYGQEFVNGTQPVRLRRQRRRRADCLDRRPHGSLRRGRVDAARDRLGLVRRHHGRTGLVPPVQEVSVGRPDGIPRPLPARVRQQRQDADDGDDRRGGSADADGPERGVLSRAQDAEEGDAARSYAGGVPRMAPAVTPAAAAALPDGVVRQIQEAIGDFY